jgi:hypothetical protein
MSPSSPSSSPPSTIPSSSQPTPKRKRENEPTTIPPTPPASSPNPKMRLNTNIPGAVLMPPDEELSGSPRTKVAYHFRGLQLEDGGAVSKLDLQRGNAPRLEARDESLLAESAVRKRVRVLGGRTSSHSPEREIPETPNGKSFRVVIGDERTVDPMVARSAGKVVLHNYVDPAISKSAAVGRPKSGGGLGKAYPSINRLSDSKSRAPKKRMDSPPLFGSAEASLEMQDGGEGRMVVDPDRAALTWHDDEITGHNPDDPDDDGEGINGIGFKPTPAMAYARTEKRRAQMAEYRNREAREARAKRSERRGGSEWSKPSKEELETARRVRFLEAEAKSVVSTR